MNRTPLPEILASAIRFWERGRLLYNATLALIVALYFLAAWPGSLVSVTLDHSLQVFLQAVVANVLYCAAYPVDVFVQLSTLREPWLRFRWVLFIIGLAFAGVITRFVSLELFHGIS